MSPLWLKSLPWSSILSNAPLIVEGAKKLASLVKSKPADEAISQAADRSEGDPPPELSVLRARVQRLEEEQRQAAELVRKLAESHAQMAQVLEALRARARLNMRVAFISLAGLVALLLWMLARFH
jgi:ATP/maltotriose-dependent transcriptional regulator MalT